ncbi:MAG: CopD family protein [Anaerolineales bacterium]|jgi:uncharacterized membrane protein
MTPDWALTLIYWTHMLATVVWIGGLALLLLLVLPMVNRTLPQAQQAVLLERIQSRFDPIIWLCLMLLVATGLFQMSASPNYKGFLAIDNRWAVAILIKHLIFLGMIAVNAAVTWVVLPGLRRVALKRQKGLEAPEEARLQRQELLLLRTNLVLGMVILGLTALARVS